MSNVTRDAVIHAALERVPTPEHGPDFWDHLDRRLDETAPPPRADRPWSRQLRPIVLAAASVIVLALAVVVASSRDQDATIGTADTPEAPDTPAASAHTTTGRAQAEGAVSTWLDVVASGDLADAWDRLSPESQQSWGSFEDFESARSGLAEGFAQWADAGDRVSGAVEIDDPAHDAAFVVTISGTRTAEGITEHSGVGFIVVDDGNGPLVEPFTPAADPITFVQPAPGPAPADLTPKSPVEIEVPTGGTFLIVVDHETKVDDVPIGEEGLGVYLPGSGWAPGRHVVTAVHIPADGPSTTAVAVFDVVP